VIETTALGAAYLAGIAVGFWSNIDSIATHWRVDKTFNPMMQRGRVAEIRERWSEALGRAKNWEPHSPSECTNHPIKPT
jgi:glycerol kinase